jgi:hypothetical protein
MYSSCSFKISAIYGGEWSASRPGRFIPGERTPGTHWTGGWVGPIAGLDTEAGGKIISHLPGIEPRLAGSPVCSQDTILPELPRLPPSTLGSLN